MHQSQGKKCNYSFISAFFLLLLVMNKLKTFLKIYMTMEATHENLRFVNDRLATAIKYFDSVVVSHIKCCLITLKTHCYSPTITHQFNNSPLITEGDESNVFCQFVVHVWVVAYGERHRTKLLFYSIHLHQRDKSITVKHVWESHVCCKGKINQCTLNDNNTSNKKYLDICQSSRS